MTHREAERSGAAAKYLLGELSDKERDAFEEHLFSCRRCARTIQADVILKACRQAAVRHVPGQEVQAARNGHFWEAMFDWLSVRPKLTAAALLAAACIAPLTAFQTFYELPRLQEQIGQLTSPRALAYHQLETTRSAARTVRLQKDCMEVALWFDLDLGPYSDEKFPNYTCIIESETGRRMPIPHPATEDFTLRLLVPCSELPSGSYTMSVYGVRDQAQVLIDQFGFETQLE